MVAEELLISPLRERLLSDENFLAAVETLGAQARAVTTVAAKATLVLEPTEAGPDDSVLTAKLGALKAARAVGALERHAFEAQCARLRAEHERAKAASSPGNPALMEANLERLRAALLSASNDVLRDALRRTLWTVRCMPVVDGEVHYLLAQFDGGVHCSGHRKRLFCKGSRCQRL